MQAYLSTTTPPHSPDVVLQPEQDVDLTPTPPPAQSQSQNQRGRKRVARNRQKVYAALYESNTKLEKALRKAQKYRQWMFVDWFVPVYLLVSVLVLAGFGACLYFLEPGLQDAHKWSNKSIKHQPLVPTLKTHRDDDSSMLI
ncbi:long intergenic non-protein coding RNA 634 isoform X2 [Tachysurus ichikawai]